MIDLSANDPAKLRTSIKHRVEVFRNKISTNVKRCILLNSLVIPYSDQKYVELGNVFVKY